MKIYQEVLLVENVIYIISMRLKIIFIFLYITWRNGNGNFRFKAIFSNKYDVIFLLYKEDLEQFSLYGTH